MGADTNLSEGDSVTEYCKECDTDTEQEVVEIKSDGSGFRRCQDCEKLIVCMAGTF